MKKFTTFIAALLITFISFATDSDEVSPQVRTSFQKRFSAASDVHWEKSGAVYFASFKLSGQDVTAVYFEDGELKSSTRKLSLSQLPLKVLFTVQEKYPGYVINDQASENFSNDESTYLINVENDKNKLSVRLNGLGSITSADKTKK